MNAKRADGEKRGISPLIVLGIVLLVVVLGIAGYLGWLFLGTNAVARQAAADELAAIRAAWAQPVADPTTPDPDGAPVVEQPRTGEGAWILRIPRIDGQWPVIAGVEADQLNRGVGWYPGSAVPGQVGNFAVTAHCTFNGEPFRRLLELRDGDQVIIETRTATFTYDLVSAPGNLTVNADDSWVIDPVPGKPDQVPTEPLITLTTCEDTFPTADRAVGFGTLTKTEKK